MKKIISWILVILWAYIIFSFSNQTGENSGGLSIHITEFILNLFNLEVNTEILNTLHFVVRKTAHFTEYAIFAIFIFNAIYNTFKLKLKYIFLISFLSASLYSLSDEFHQLFIADRVGSLTDCLIDSCGALTGSLFCLIVIYILQKFTLRKV